MCQRLWGLLKGSAGRGIIGRLTAAQSERSRSFNIFSKDRTYELRLITNLIFHSQSPSLFFKLFANLISIRKKDGG